MTKEQNAVIIDLLTRIAVALEGQGSIVTEDVSPELAPDMQKEADAVKAAIADKDVSTEPGSIVATPATEPGSIVATPAAEPEPEPVPTPEYLQALNSWLVECSTALGDGGTSIFAVMKELGISNIAEVGVTTVQLEELKTKVAALFPGS